MDYYQQGDVLIKPFDFKDGSYLSDSVREGTTKEVKELVVAYGEASGHSHVIKGEKITQFIPKWHRDQIVFSIDEDSYIYHEEHGEILIPAGTYYIDTVREYDHFAEESRYVRD